MALKNLVLTILGFILLALGGVCLLLPVLPTTPFVLAAALCFAGGNSRFSLLLRRNRVFGPYIENYYTGHGVSKTRKISGIIFVWAGLSISMYITRTLWICIILGIVGVCVTVHLLLIKTRKKVGHEPHQPREPAG